MALLEHVHTARLHIRLPWRITRIGLSTFPVAVAGQT